MLCSAAEAGVDAVMLARLRQSPIRVSFVSRLHIHRSGVYI